MNHSRLAASELKGSMADDCILKFDNQLSRSVQVQFPRNAKRGRSISSSNNLILQLTYNFCGSNKNFWLNGHFLVVKKRMKQRCEVTDIIFESLKAIFHDQRQQVRKMLSSLARRKKLLLPFFSYHLNQKRESRKCFANSYTSPMGEI